MNNVMSIIFNGIYTITNIATEEHRTFRIKTQKSEAKFAAGKRIVSLLNGPNNETSYLGFAFVNQDKVTVWDKKRGNGKRSSFDHFAYLLPKAAQALIGSEGQELKGTFEAYSGRKYAVELSKRCLACNRRLTTPESLRRGYGPECSDRLGIE